MTAPLVLISRGIAGETVFRGSFNVVLRELQGDTICLTGSELDGDRVVSVKIRADVLEQVDAPEDPATLSRTLRGAEDRVLDRHSL